MSVEVYSSYDFGNKKIDGADKGTFANIVKQCLIDGAPMPSVTSITRTGVEATIVFDNNHGFITPHHTIIVSGCDQENFNGTYRARVNSNNSLTYTVADLGDTAATGAIEAIKAPAGWSMALDEGDVILIKNQGSQTYYRIRDNGIHQSTDTTEVNTIATVTGALDYLSMDELLTPFPRTVTGINRHSNTWYGTPFPRGRLDSDAAHWILIADKSTCYWVHSRSELTSWTSTKCYAFGDIGLLANIVTHPKSIVAGGDFLSSSSDAYWYSLDSLLTANQSSGKFLSHSLTDGAASIRFLIQKKSVGINTLGADNPWTLNYNPSVYDMRPYPDPIIGGAVLEHIYLYPNVSNHELSRFAKLRGLLACLHPVRGDTGSIGLPGDILNYNGRDYLLLGLVNNGWSGPEVRYGSFALDVTGEW